MTGDYFIPLLAPKTLNSENVRHEIEWAYQAKKACIPVWYFGFSLENHLKRQKSLSLGIKNTLVKDMRVL